jgi:hypothetical protein
MFFLMVSSLLNRLCDECSIQSTIQNNVINTAANRVQALYLLPMHSSYSVT